LNPFSIISLIKNQPVYIKNFKKINDRDWIVAHIPHLQCGPLLV
jgi:hypothetical protein